jgi:hypothetical protein
MIWSQPGSGSWRMIGQRISIGHSIMRGLYISSVPNVKPLPRQPVVSDFWTENNHGNAALGVSLSRDPL